MKSVVQKWWFWFGLSFILYANTLNHEYTIDDMIVATSNKLTQKGIAGIPEIFSHSYLFGYDGREDESYRPLTLSTFAIEKSLFDAKSSASHFIQIVLYGICILLLFNFLKRLFHEKNIYIPVIITALYMLHPIHTEVVANVKSRDELLCALFLFASLNSFAKWINSKSVVQLMASLFLFFLSTLSKETAVMGIVLFPITYYFIKPFNWKALLKISALYIVPFGLYFVIRSMVLTDVLIENPIDPVANSLAAIQDPAVRFATNLSIFTQYIQLSVFPIHMSWDYSIAQIAPVGLGSAAAMTGLIFLLGMFAFAIYGLLKKKMLGFGAVFFLTTFILTSNFLFLINCNLGERFLFLPVLGVMIILVMLLEPLFRKIPRTGILVLTGLICLSFTVRTVNRSSQWKNNLTIYEAGVQVSPKSVKTHFNLGTEYLEQGNRSGIYNEKITWYDKAIRELNTAKRIYPNYSNIYENLGFIYAELSKIDPDTLTKVEFLKIGLVELDYAIQSLQMDKPTLFQNSFYTLEKLIEYSKNEEDKMKYQLLMIQKAEYKKDKTAEDIQRIIYYSKRIDDFENVKQWSTSLLKNHQDVSGYVIQLSQEYYNEQKFKESLELQKLYVDQFPSDLNAKSNLGMLYEITGDKKKAKMIYEEILKADPNQEHTRNLYNNLKL